MLKVIHLTQINIYWVPTYVPGTVPGAGDKKMNKILFFYLRAYSLQKKNLPFIRCLVYVKCYACPTFNFSNNLVKWILLLFYRWETEGSERLSRVSNPMSQLKCGWIWFKPKLGGLPRCWSHSSTNNYNTRPRSGTSKALGCQKKPGSDPAGGNQGRIHGEEAAFQLSPEVWVGFP